MNVLYLNHTGQISGGERSLLDLVSGLPDGVSATVACPDGPLAGAVRDLGLPVVHFPMTEGSLKLHVWHTARGVLDIARATRSVRHLARRLNADLVHANSIRAGLAGAFATSLGGKPAVVHVHDRLPAGAVSSLALKQIGKRAAAVIANSQYTKASFDHLRPTSAIRVVHGPVDLERFDPGAIDRAEARARLGFESSTFVLAVIAQITPWKGQDDAIRILGLVKRSHPNARLLVVGSPKFVSGATRYDNLAYLGQLEHLTHSLGLQDDVVFLGERDDIPELLGGVDLLIHPSWEEPFGLAIIEAMAMQVPVVATEVGGPSEIVRSGEDGLLLPPRKPEAWAAAISNMIGRPDLRAEMARKGRARATGMFGREAHVNAVLAVYEELLNASRASPGNRAGTVRP